MAGQEGKIYQFGDFRLDLHQRILERDGTLLPVPPKAVDLLIVLVENAGTIVDKKTLFELVWPGIFVVESSLTKNISLLRRTLADTDAGESMIQTVSKRGYRFVAPVSEEPSPPVLAEPVILVPLPIRRDPRPVIAGIALPFVAAIWLLLRSPAPAPAPEVPSPASREYLIGQYFWGKLEPGQMGRAQEHFRRAVELDPNSASAYAGLADSYVFMTMMGTGNRAANLESAKAAAQRALTLDPKLARPHIGLARVKTFSEFDVAGAEREYRTALRLEPNSAYAHYSYACLLSLTGRLTEARDHNHRAWELDPVSPVIGFQAGRIEIYARHYQEAIGRLQGVLERDPGFSLAHYYLSVALGLSGRPAEALAHLQQSRVNASLLATDEAWLHALAGDPEPARRLVAERRKLVEAGGKPTGLLMPAIAAGDRELGLWALEQMAKTKEIELLETQISPRFELLRSDARYSAVLDDLWSRDGRPFRAALDLAPNPMAVRQ